MSQDKCPFCGVDLQKTKGGPKHCVILKNQLAQQSALLRECRAVVEYFAKNPNRWTPTETWGFHEDAQVLLPKLDAALTKKKPS